MMDKMKNFDLILLQNEKPYTNFGLQKGIHGVILNINFDILDVLFFNPKNQGDYIIVKINVNDIVIGKEKLSKNLINKLNEEIKNKKLKAKLKFESLKVKAYDMVELLVENAKYAKYGIHKGDKGCVMDDNAVQNYVEVDFSGIDKNGNFYGDCISVNVDDLKVIE